MRNVVPLRQQLQCAKREPACERSCTGALLADAGKEEDTP